MCALAKPCKQHAQQILKTTNERQTNFEDRPITIAISWKNEAHLWIQLFMEKPSELLVKFEKTFVNQMSPDVNNFFVA
jgi:hypothetical protein